MNNNLNQDGSLSKETGAGWYRQNDPLFDAASGIPTSGDESLNSLVGYLARTVDVHCAWAAESISAPEPTLRTLAVSIGHKDAGNFQYSIAGTPAQDMFTNTGICLYSSNVQRHFPGDSTLRACDANGYAGIPLVDSTGTVLGLLAMASRNPLNNNRLTTSLLRVCANRATAELVKRKADAALRASEARLKLIFDHAPDAYLLLSVGGKLLEANRSAERLTGLTRAEMVGRNVLLPGILSEAEIRRAADRLRERAAGAPARPEEFTLFHRNGSKVFVETYSEMATIDGEKVMLLCMRDITSRKMAQQERQNQMDRTHQLRNAALSLATYEANGAEDGRQMGARVTRTVCGLTGAAAVSIWLFSVDEPGIRCLDRFEASTGIHSGGDAVFSEKCALYRSELRQSAVIVVADIPGDVLSQEPGRVRLIPGTTGQLLEAGIRRGEQIAGVLRMEHAHGDARHWEPEELQFAKTVSRVLGQRLLIADRPNSTGIKRTEEKPEGSIARELAERLAVIQGHGSLIMRSPADENVVRASTEAILNACQGASGFIRRSLRACQPQTNAPFCEINCAVRDFEGVLSGALGANIPVSLALDAAAGTVGIGMAEIHQILLGLAVNAHDSMPLGGHLTIETARIQGEEEFTSGDGCPEFGSWVMLAAIATEYRGIRTSAGEQGSNPAMSTVYALVQRCGGRIDVRSDAGKSTEGKTKTDLVATEIKSIIEQSGKVKTIVDNVNAGSMEQARGIDQVTKAIGQMGQVTQQTAATAEESAAAAEELSAQSESLQEIVVQLTALVTGTQSRRQSVELVAARR